MREVDFAIYGAGGLGREIYSLLDYFNRKSCSYKWNFIGFFDDGKEIGSSISGFGTCLGGIKELNSYLRPIDIALCFGNAHNTKKVRDGIINKNVSFPNLILPDLWISRKDRFTMGEGNIICGKCTFTTDIEIGNFNLFNGEVTVGHDVKIGDYNIFMPGCRISGEVLIGNDCTIGSQSFIHQQLTIPDNVTLSPLSALLTNPKKGRTYIGNPAKLFRY